jgi:NitT/TauT family transport system permease protein
MAFETVEQDRESIDGPGRRPLALAAVVASYLLVPVGFLALWEVSALWFAKALGSFFPPPTTVVLSIYDWLTGATGSTAIYSGELLIAIRESLYRVVVAYLIAGALGIPLGVLVGRFVPFRRIADPFLQMVRPIPVTAWVPISMLWFGIGDKAAVYLIVLAAFFPIYVNTVQGVRYVDRVTIRAGRMLGAGGWRLLLYVIVPAALPSIFAGLRVSVGFAWMAVVVSELVAVKSGLGYVMFEAYGFLRADLVIAAMIVIGALGFTCDRLMLRLERRVLGWAHHAGEG